MATQEKLVKTLDVLKTLVNSKQSDGKKKEKIQLCHIASEAISNATIKVAQNFTTYLSITVEVLLELCDDQDSDVRMTAEECLNIIIRALNDGNIGKVQIELHKGIKRNGGAKALRAALWRFSKLAHLIRPHKGKAYVSNLLPTIIKISTRKEEQIHETLSGSLLPIMQALGNFTTDNDIKGLLKAFLRNVSHESASIRRSTNVAIVNICLNCRKPNIFLLYVISQLLDTLVPVNENHNNNLILGVLNCLKSILSHLDTSNDPLMREACLVFRENDPISYLTDKLLQTYELCLHYFADKDHNVVNAALETMNVLLQNCSFEFQKMLISPLGISKSRISSSPSLLLYSPSELSVAANLEDCVESELTETIRSDIDKWIGQSQLSVMDLTCAKVAYSTSADSKATSIDVSLSEIDTTDYKITEYGITGANSNSIDNLDSLSNDSSEKFSCIDEEKRSDFSQEISVGTFLDKEVPLIHCARLIVKSFLLSGNSGICTSDKLVRVSGKSLALVCLASIVKLYPKVMLLFLDKNYSEISKSVSNQPISDVFLYCDHSDPQLRGLLRSVLANFLQAILQENGDYEEWIIGYEAMDIFEMGNIINILAKGLSDESSTCVRQTLTSLNMCLETILESESNGEILPILKILPYLATNPYWLIKVSLCELVSQLPFVTIRDVTESNNFQNQVLHNVLLQLIQEDDARVRSAAANAIVKIIPNLYYEQFQLHETTVSTKATHQREMYLSHLNETNNGINLRKKRLFNNIPFPFREIATKKETQIEFSLSKIVMKLFNFLLTSTTKSLILGSLETLSLLSNKYPSTVYTQAWNCQEISNSEEANKSSVAFDLITRCVYLLTNSVISYDLACHVNLLNLSSNLYAGKALHFLQTSNTLESPHEPWSLFNNPKFAKLSEHFLCHMMKLLNILHHILEESIPIQPQQKPVLSNLSTSSPIKRRKSDLEKKAMSPNKFSEKEETTKIATSGVFVHLPHYMTLYKSLRCAYTNYKVSLDTVASEKFTDFLRQSLKTFSIIMEVGGLVEFQEIAEEILGYLRYTFALDASATVDCVQQLLKCLFGTNIITNITEVIELTKETEEHKGYGFYYNIYQKPYNDISTYLNALKSVNVNHYDDDSTIMGYLHRKKSVQLGIATRTSDKILANYIRIFEPMVIKSLKQYTMTSDVKLQCKVLQLLNQLIQLKVNYCLLDSEQIFIGFVLKQFEYIEEGQIPFVNELIADIFEFLVQLSYSKQHSKSIISIPKIIQLCDGLIASGQSTITHCIPALCPIVENIFFARNKSNTTDMKELETTREVVISMLLKLSENNDVMDLVVLILNDSKYCLDNPDKWLKWSEQVYKVVISMLQQDRLQLDDEKKFSSMQRLILALEPTVLKPMDGFLIALFQEILTEETFRKKGKSSLGKIVLILFIITIPNEELLLSKIDKLKNEFSPSSIFEVLSPTVDPLNVMNGSNSLRSISTEMILVRFLFKVLTVASNHCIETTKDDFVVEELGNFLVYCIYLFQSGRHCKIGMSAISNLDYLELEKINTNFLKLSVNFPILTFLWCYFLSLLNYKNPEFWRKLCSMKSKSSLNKKVVSTGAVILFCDYMNEDAMETEQLSWFLNDCLPSIINLSPEEPISEFISSLHRDSTTSKLFLNAIAKLDIKDKGSVFISKILKFVEKTHTSGTGLLLQILLPNYLVNNEITIARNVANISCRKIELLLTMSVQEVNTQLEKDKLLGIIRTLSFLKLVKKYEALSSLLNKLCMQCYDTSPLPIDQNRKVSFDRIKTTEIDKKWYLSQIKEKCIEGVFSPEAAQLLMSLTKEEVVTLLNSSKFNKINLKECLQTGEQPIMEVCMDCIIKQITLICGKIPSPHQVYKVKDREQLSCELEFSNELTKLFQDEVFITELFNIIPPLIQVPLNNHDEVLVQFGVMCLESINYLIGVKKHFDVSRIANALHCANQILQNIGTSRFVNSNKSRLYSAVNSLFVFIQHILEENEPLPNIPPGSLLESFNDPVTKAAAHCCHQIYTLVCWLCKRADSQIPISFSVPIKGLIVSLSRLPFMYSYVMIPEKMWKSGWPPDPVAVDASIPPLPADLLQEREILEDFIFRMNLLGWTTRQQFEETWMCLLSLLCGSNDDNDVEAAQAASLAVKGITSLLSQTMYYPIPGYMEKSKLVHISRDPHISVNTLDLRKLKTIQDYIEKKHSVSSSLPQLLNVFNWRNLEKCSEYYTYNQISIKYLLIATKIREVEPECEASTVWKLREELLKNHGLDVNSCLQFLLDFYTPLLKQQTTPLRFLHEAIKSVVVISDLFTDKTQFQWMLDLFSELAKVHNVEDELLHQYLVVGISKAVAILTPDLDTYENVKKILVQHLKSSFLPSKISSLHGLLYILEGCKYSNITIGGISEEMQIILPCAVEYVQCNININGILKHSQEHTLLVWSLAFFLIENVEEVHMEANFVSNTLQTALMLLKQKPTLVLHTALIKGLERLTIVKGTIAVNTRKQIKNLALESLRNEDSSISMTGFQLLLTYMYTGCDVGTLKSVQTNPDDLVQMIEIISAIFEYIKRGYFFEVEILCHVLPDILNDFFAPPDILTKVISEFLSPQQPYQKLLSRVIFRVFEKAIENEQLSLLQDWVVFSLSNFTQSLPLGMATWCLTCFFISASSNQWLRLFFPYVQTRVGRCEYEDRRMLCLVASDFYRHLSTDVQKRTFVENFSKMKDQPDPLFNDLLSCL